MQDDPIGPFSDLHGPRHHLVSETFIGFTVSLRARRGLYTEVGFVCVPGHVLAHCLSFLAAGVTWVLLRVS